MAIQFNFQKRIKLSNRRILKRFLKEIFDKEGIQLDELHYIFCDDNYILNVNQTFLKHDYFTDIITFDMTTPGAPAVSGEVYISVDMVLSNSLKFKTSFYNELSRVIFHGVLHLCGYKDKSEKDKKMMREKEDFYLQLFEKLD